MIKNFLVQIRPMRVVLISLALLTLVLKAPIDMELSYEGWNFIRTIIMPVMAPLFFMVILLDSLIATIWFTQTTGSEHSRYRLILFVNLTTAFILGMVWIPFLLELLG